MASCLRELFFTLEKLSKCTLENLWQRAATFHCLTHFSVLLKYEKIHILTCYNQWLTFPLHLSILTFSMGHFYSPGAVKRIGVEVRKARRQNCSRFTINITSTKSWKCDRQRRLEHSWIFSFIQKTKNVHVFSTVKRSPPVIGVMSSKVTCYYCHITFFSNTRKYCIIVLNSVIML